MIDRRRLTTLDKLKIIMEQAYCPRCSERLGDLDGVDFDHVHPLALGGSDTLDNLQALHRDCHAIKTNGTGSTTAGSDKNRIAKVRRNAERNAEFCRRMMEKGSDEPRQQSKWPKRPFQRRA